MTEKTIWTDILGGDDEIGNVDLKRALKEVPEKTIWTTAEIIREANYTWSDNDVLLVKNNKKWISADKVKELKDSLEVIFFKLELSLSGRQRAFNNIFNKVFGDEK